MKTRIIERIVMTQMPIKSLMKDTLNQFLITKQIIHIIEITINGLAYADNINLSILKSKRVFISHKLTNLLIIEVPIKEMIIQ